MLQETRHHDANVFWARSLAARLGWLSTFSAVPPKNSAGFIGCGGTAILWRRGLGRATVCRSAPLDSHRCIAIRWAGFAVASVYGPQIAAVEWVDTLWQCLAGFGCPVYAGGDYNWKAPYARALPSQACAVNQPSTTIDGTTPVRLIAFDNAECKCEDVLFLPGIPRHGLVTWRTPSTVAVAQQETRLRRTGLYRWHSDDIPSADAVDPTVCDAAETCCDAWAPLLPDGAPLLARWARCHLRAESVLQFLTRQGLLRCDAAPERDKGSRPSVKPVAAGAAHRCPESVALRRLRRTSRRVAERLRSGHENCEFLSPDDAKKWQALCCDGLVSSVGVPTLAEAAHALAHAVHREAARAQSDRNADWKRQFRTWSDSLWTASKSVMRPCPTAGFNVEDMANDWKPIWCPTPDPCGNHADAWRSFAQGREPHLCSTDLHRLPAFEDFLAAAHDVHGGPGFDGWTTHEAKILLRFAPWWLREIFDLWCETTLLGEEIPSDLRAYLWAWRTVGIPKGENDSRPISVGSIWMRAWHHCLLACFPPCDDSDWCCRRGASVIRGTADWLSAEKDCGAEHDLSKAFDSLDHDVLRAAFAEMHLPPRVIGTLMNAWTAPRICQVNGALASPILPTRGVPQGDPCSPRALVCVLSAWCPIAKKWLYMDDRTLAAAGESSQHQLRLAMDYTSAFDSTVGLKENLGKRQLWGPGGSSRIEHLGLSVCPLQPVEPILPRGGWARAYEVIARLARLPGSAPVRERLAFGYVRPHFTWAVPLMHPPPARCASLLMRAILRTDCRWYCSGRWWADRVLLHPTFTAAVSTFKESTRHLPTSAHLVCALREHAHSLGLLLAGYAASGAVLLCASDDDDPRVLQAIEHAGVPGGLERAFQTDTPGGQHALRLIARVRCLQTVRMSRQDSEAAHLVHLPSQSALCWRRWRASLTSAEAARLRLWRAGAVGSPTRHSHRRGFSPQCKLCGAPLASTRHLWAECPFFAWDRHQLEEAFRVPAVWWSCQPRITAKSGWITTLADSDAQRLPLLQIMACRLAVIVVAVIHATHVEDNVPLSSALVRPVADRLSLL